MFYDRSYSLGIVIITSSVHQQLLYINWFTNPLQLVVTGGINTEHWLTRSLDETPRHSPDDKVINSPGNLHHESRHTVTQWVTTMCDGIPWLLLKWFIQTRNKSRQRGNTDISVTNRTEPRLSCPRLSRDTDRSVRDTRSGHVKETKGPECPWTWGAWSWECVGVYVSQRFCID